MIQNRRAFFAQGLSGFYLPIYQSLCGILPETWQPICGIRSLEQQAARYAQGRDTDGPIVTNAKPGLSFHNYGLASDWGYFQDGDGRKYQSLESNDPLWAEYEQACEKVGARMLSFEKPHNEMPLKTHIGELYLAYTQGGMPAVNVLIQKELSC